jgi:hypothetical protein
MNCQRFLEAPEPKGGRTAINNFTTGIEEWQLTFSYQMIGGVMRSMIAKTIREGLALSNIPRAIVHALEGTNNPARDLKKGGSA